MKKLRSQRGIAARRTRSACRWASVGQADEEMRTWTTADGRHKTQAALLGFKDGMVQLRKADGKEISVPASRLCARRSGLRARGTPAAQAGIRASHGEKSRRGLGKPLPRPPDRGRGGEAPISTVCAGRPACCRNGPKAGRSWRGKSKGSAPALPASRSSAARSSRWAAAAAQSICSPSTPRTARPCGPRRSVPAATERGSNCTPTVDGDLVYAISIEGDLICARTDNGETVWRKNFARDFGGKMMSGWGYSESPLVDGNLLVCTPGGEQAVMAALDKKTGRPVWTTAMPYGGSNGKDGAGYSSIVISQGAGVKQYIQLVGRGLIGVDADSGQLLWRYDRIANGTANIPTAIVSGDYVFCSTGYGTGAALLKLTRSGRGVQAQEQYFLDAGTLQNHHGGMVLLDGYIYCGHRHNEGFPICVEMKTGRVKWGGDQRGAGSGSAAVLYADGNLYFRYQNGIMALIEATPERYNLKSSFKLASVRAESWPHPVIADGKLLLRDQEVLMCYDVKAN